MMLPQLFSIFFSILVTLSYAATQDEIIIHLVTTNDIGKSKSKTAKLKLEAQNPLISIAAYDFELTNENAIDLFNQYDRVIYDNIDQPISINSQQKCS